MSFNGPSPRRIKLQTNEPIPLNPRRMNKWPKLQADGTYTTYTHIYQSQMQPNNPFPKPGPKRTPDARDKITSVILPVKGMPVLEDIKKRVISDILISPITLVPVAAGMTGLIATWANDGPAWLALAGGTAILATLGVTATRYLAFGESLAAKAYEEIKNKAQHDRQRSLLALHDTLRAESDNLSKTAFSSLISVYDTFQKRCEDDLSSTSKLILKDKVEALFESCIKQLQHSHSLWVEQIDLRGPSKAATKDRRAKEIEEVAASVDSMTKILDGVSVQPNEDSGDLAEKRRDLENSMEVAKRTEERMNQISGNHENQ